MIKIKWAFHILLFMLTLFSCGSAENTLPPLNLEGIEGYVDSDKEYRIFEQFYNEQVKEIEALSSPEQNVEQQQKRGELWCYTIAASNPDHMIYANAMEAMADDFPKEQFAVSKKLVALIVKIVTSKTMKENGKTDVELTDAHMAEVCPITLANETKRGNDESGREALRKRLEEKAKKYE